MWKLAEPIVIPSSVDSQHPLPSRQELVVTEEFVNKGYEFVEAKKERKRLQREYQSINHSLLFIHRNQLLTNRQIERQYQHLQYLIKIKRRKQEQVEQKRRANQEERERLEALNSNIKNYKQNHQERVSQSKTEMLSNNKQEYWSTKMKEDALNRDRRENFRMDLQAKRSQLEQVNQKKEVGSRKIMEYKMGKSKKYTKDYIERIREEEASIAYLAREIQELGDEKVGNNRVLDKKMGLSQQLKFVIESSSTADVHTLSKYSRKSEAPSKRREPKITRTKNRTASNNSKVSNTETYENPQQPEHDLRQSFLSYRQPHHRHVSQDVSRSEKISQTVELIERSDIFSLIKGESEHRLPNPKKQKRSKKRVELKSKRSYQRLYKLI